jgi:hypothetical protein
LIPARAAAPPSDVNNVLVDEGYRRAKAVVNSFRLWSRRNRMKFGLERHQNVIGSMARGAEKSEARGQADRFSGSAFVLCLTLLRCVMTDVEPRL